MMDCDTTGIEPDLALVKYKKLVGGGMIKIVNNTVPAALFKLGYTNPQVDSIVSYIDSTGTIEGAPGIKPEHLAVFDCSFKPSKGTRSIHSSGHIKMMAAAQPFLSGAISKTVNLPHDATLDDIIQAYTEAWRLGLKAVAIYRDGSKGAQPLNVSDGNKAKVIKNALGTESTVDAAVTAAADRVLAAMAQGDTTSIGDDLQVLEDKVSARLEVTANSVVTAANAFSASIANAVNLGQACCAARRTRKQLKDRPAPFAIACRRSVPHSRTSSPSPATKATSPSAFTPMANRVKSSSRWPRKAPRSPGSWTPLPLRFRSPCSTEFRSRFCARSSPTLALSPPAGLAANRLALPSPSWITSSAGCSCASFPDIN